MGTKLVEITDGLIWIVLDEHGKIKRVSRTYAGCLEFVRKQPGGVSEEYGVFFVGKSRRAWAIEPEFLRD